MICVYWNWIEFGICRLSGDESYMRSQLNLCCTQCFVENHGEHCEELVTKRYMVVAERDPDSSQRRFVESDRLERKLHFGFQHAWSRCTMLGS